MAAINNQYLVRCSSNLHRILQLKLARSILRHQARLLIHRMVDLSHLVLFYLIRHLYRLRWLNINKIRPSRIIILGLLNLCLNERRVKPNQVYLLCDFALLFSHAAEAIDDFELEVYVWLHNELVDVAVNFILFEKCINRLTLVVQHHCARAMGFRLVRESEAYAYFRTLFMSFNLYFSAKWLAYQLGYGQPKADILMQHVLRAIKHSLNLLHSLLRHLRVVIHNTYLKILNIFYLRLWHPKSIFDFLILHNCFVLFKAADYFESAVVASGGYSLKNHVFKSILQPVLVSFDDFGR